MAGAGDVNGDGFADIALGAPFFDSGQTNEGGVFVFHGGTVVDLAVDRVVEKNVAGALLGSAIASADTNGDGYSDLAIGVPLETDYTISEFGTVWITIGSANGLGAENYPVRGLSSSTTAGRFGSALAFVDYNGNGYPELFVGAPEESGGAGRPAQGFAYMVRSGLRLSSNIDDTLDGTQSGAQLGHAIATGDINRDGLGDIAVGLPNFDTGSVNVGRVELYYGAPGGFNATPDAVLNGGTAQARFGRAVAIGDFNGDSYGDLAVGAPDQITNGGEVHVFYGGPGAFNTTVDRVISIAQFGARHGEVVANVGDLTGDGIVELGDRCAFGRHWSCHGRRCCLSLRWHWFGRRSLARRVPRGRNRAVNNWA
ncbi:MAG: FG-GAP repeat protein [Ahniella sp.]|nr:FG-GAP repeat protein [Ahniella sp.]